MFLLYIFFCSIINLSLENKAYSVEIPNSNFMANFTNLESKELFEKDLQAFDYMVPYHKTLLSQLDTNDPFFPTQITQQLMEGAKDGDPLSFLPFKQSSTFFILDYDIMGFKISPDTMYDQETKSYIKKYGSPENTQLMKQIQEKFFKDQKNKILQTQKYLESHANEYLPRPKHLPKDFQQQFLQISNSQSPYPIRENVREVKIKECWASSRHEFDYQLPNKGQNNDNDKIIYPCFESGETKKHGDWISEKIDEKNQKEIAFRLEFESITRIRQVSILFLFPPSVFKIESTQDMKFWETITKPYKFDQNQNLELIQPTIEIFNPMIFSKALKIMMVGTSSKAMRLGISQVRVFSQEQTVMLMQKNQPETPQCLATTEQTFGDINKPNVLMNCYDAILQNDAREIFILDQQFIKTWSENESKICLSPVPSKSNDPIANPQFILTQKCKESGDLSEQEWIINSLGKVASKADTKKCLTAMSNKRIQQVQEYGSVQVSSSIEDSRSNPYSVIKDSGWWAPPRDATHANFEIIFDRTYLVDRVVIGWLVYPPKFELMVKTVYDRWKVMSNEVCDSSETEILIPPIEIKGVKIILLEMNSDKIKVGNKNVINYYGIKKLQIFRPGRAAMLMDCATNAQDEDMVNNRWTFEEVQNINIQQKAPYQDAENYLEQIYTDSVQKIRQFMVKLKSFQQAKQRADRIKQALVKLNQNLIDLQGRLTSIKDSTKNQKSQAPMDISNYKTTCAEYRENAPFMLNGYYWIKTECMDVPFRVFCDFDNNKGNFYLYNGFKASKKMVKVENSSQQSIYEACQEKGLTPVQIRNTQIYTTMIDFLQQSESISEDEYVIPVGYNFNPENVGEYKSMNNEKSLRLDIMLASYIGDIKKDKKLDALIIRNKKGQLAQAHLQDQKIRGVVCSENLNEAQSVSVKTCDDVITQAGMPGETIDWQCPAKCEIKDDQKSNQSSDNEKYFQINFPVCQAVVINNMGKPGKQLKLKIKFFNSDPFLKDKSDSLFIGTDPEASQGYELIKIENCPAQKKKSFISFDEIMQNISKKSTKPHNVFIQSDETANNEQRNYQKNKQQAQQQLMNLLQDDQKNKVKFSSKEAANKIREAMDKKLYVLATYKKYTSDSEKLIIEQNNNMALLQVQDDYKNSLNPKLQTQFTNEIYDTILNLHDQSVVVESQQNAKIQTLTQDQKFKQDAYLKSKQYEKFDSKLEKAPFNKLDAIYTIRDAKNVESSEWVLDDQKQDGYDYLIKQKIPTSCLGQSKDECISTFLEIRFKTFYDFKMLVDFNLSYQEKDGFFGLIFRKKDEFNYYTIQIHKDKIVFLRKLQGKLKEIQSNSLKTPIQSQNWYHVILDSSRSAFKLEMSQKSDPTKRHSAAFYDQIFKSGSIAIQTDNVLNSKFGKLEVGLQDCKSEPIENNVELEKILKIQTNRFREKYRQRLTQMWDNQFCQDISNYKNDFQGRKKAIMLQSKEVDKIDDNNQNNYISKNTCTLKLQNNKIEQGTIGFEILFQQMDSHSQFEMVLQPEKEKSIDSNVENAIVLTFSKKKIFLNARQNKKTFFLDKTEQKDTSQTQKQIEIKDESNEIIEELQENVWYQFYLSLSGEKAQLYIYNKYDKDQKEFEKKFQHVLEVDIPQELRNQAKIILFKSKNKAKTGIDDFFIDMKQFSRMQDQVIQNQKDQEEQEEAMKNQEKDQDQSDLEESYKLLDKTKFLQIKMQTKQNLDEDMKIVCGTMNGVDQCKNSSTYDQRAYFCKKPTLIETQKCILNFCPQCCNTAFDNYKNKCIEELENCKKDCNNNQEDTPIIELQECHNPTQKSMFDYCDDTHSSNIWLKNFCKIDFCKSCCSLTPISLMRDTSDEQIQQCNQECEKKFNIQK